MAFATYIVGVLLLMAALAAGAIKIEKLTRPPLLEAKTAPATPQAAEPETATEATARRRQPRPDRSR